MGESSDMQSRSAPTRAQRRELSSLRVGLLAQLPVRARFFVYMPGIPKDVAFVTHELAEPRATSREVLFDGLELRAIAEAAACDRLWPTDFLELCIRKWNDPSFRVDRGLTLEGADGLAEGSDVAGAQLAGFTVGALLQRLGATLIGLDLEDRDTGALGLAA